MEPGLGDRVTLERTGEHVTRLGVASQVLSNIVGSSVI